MPNPFRSRSLVALMALAGIAGSADIARAADTKKPLIVVVQSGLSADNGDALRAALAQRFELEVIAVTKTAATESQPRAILTVAVDEKNVLNALYWDESGAFDVFSAPAPKDPEALRTAAVTLASAIVQRHIDTLVHGPAKPRDPLLIAQDELLRRATVDAQLALRRSGRLAIALSWEDF